MLRAVSVGIARFVDVIAVGTHKTWQRHAYKQS